MSTLAWQKILRVFLAPKSSQYWAMIHWRCFHLFSFCGCSDLVFSGILAKALEHKASLSEFMRTYPTATVWATPGLVAFGSGLDGFDTQIISDLDCAKFNFSFWKSSVGDWSIRILGLDRLKSSAWEAKACQFLCQTLPAFLDETGRPGRTNCHARQGCVKDMIWWRMMTLLGQAHPNRAFQHFHNMQTDDCRLSMKTWRRASHTRFTGHLSRQVSQVGRVGVSLSRGIT